MEVEDSSCLYFVIFCVSCPRRVPAEQGQLAKWLVDNSCADRVFFCNSGAEANEAAIKVRGACSTIFFDVFDWFFSSTVFAVPVLA